MGMRLFILACALALAACGGESQQEVDVPLQTEAPAVSPSQTSETPSPADPALRSIPVEFLGVWDARTGTCDPASDLRLDIGEDSITFYESVGTVESVRDDGGTTMVTLAMEGEGERWAQTIGLRFFDASTSLMVIDPERPDEAEATMRQRCPE
jgi:hypothetical protein